MSAGEHLGRRFHDAIGCVAVDHTDDPLHRAPALVRELVRLCECAVDARDDVLEALRAVERSGGCELLVVLAASGAFYRAERFEDVVAGVSRALAQPDELAAERGRAVERVVGEVDGHAADRVVEAAVEVLAGTA